MVTHAVEIRFRLLGQATGFQSSVQRRRYREYWPGGPATLWIAVLLLLVAAIATTISAVSHGPDPRLDIQADRTELPAGGAAAHFTLQSSIPLPTSHLDAVITKGGHSARITRTYYDSGTWHVTVQSKALPGPVTLTATLPPFAAASSSITVLDNHRDSAGDGTPDVLRLDDPADANAFRSWFTFLAEAQFFRDTSALPAEISDCAGLIRYAYREALRSHDSVWAKTAALPLIPAIPSVHKYEYPFTPWAAALFRTGPNTLAEFADAGTLLRYNTHLVSRDIRQARPGDLIFFHQDDAAMPYHSMIYLGPSQIENARGPFVAYHTGPLHGFAPATGEIRRPSVGELLKHPDPNWHPVTDNPHYLGVYRWNILWS
jgi:uncharacterized protein YfaT (DUF1175 family)